MKTNKLFEALNPNRLLTGSLFISLCFIFGCESPKNEPNFLEQFAKTFGNNVTVDTSDQSPPTVSLTIPNLGNGIGGITLKTGDADVEYHWNKSMGQFFVVAEADDPQGVKSVCFNLGEHFNCTEDGLGHTAEPTYFPSCYGYNNTQGQPAVTHLWFPLIQDADYHSICEGKDGTDRFSIRASGENYHGIKAYSPTVTFINP